MASAASKSGEKQKVKDERSKFRETLQSVILTAVYCKHDSVITRAMKVIKDQRLDGRKPSQLGVTKGIQLLDFLPPNDSQVDPKYRSHSPLMLACELKSEADSCPRGDIDRVLLLLENGASAAFKNKEGLNALHIACNTGNLNICKALLKAAKEQNRFGVKKQFKSDLSILVNVKEKRGWTPLMYAVKNDQHEIFIELVDTDIVEFSKTNKKDASFLHIACGEGSVEVLKYIFEHPHLIPKDMFTATDKKGWNILHYACCSNKLMPGEQSLTGEQVSLVQWLLESIPSSVLSDTEKSTLLSQKNKAGYTPLLTACEYQLLPAVKHLLGQSDVDMSDIAIEGEKDGIVRGKSALHIAAIHDAPKIAELFVDDENFKMDWVDLKGNTALHITKRKSSTRVERVILGTPAGQKLLEIENQDNQLPDDVEPEDIIPPEVLKRGPDYVERFKSALRQGKEKIPRCGLLFLGEARKGKTSLYKLIVGKEFDPNQVSTRGIDNNEVDAVDSRLVSLSWSEKSEEDQQKEREESHASAILRELPPDVEKQSDYPGYQMKLENELLQTISDVNSRINASCKRKPKKPRMKDIIRIFNDSAFHDSFLDDLHDILTYDDDELLDEDFFPDNIPVPAAKKKAPSHQTDAAVPKTTPPNAPSQSAPEPKKPISKPKPKASEPKAPPSSLPKKATSAPETRQPVKPPQPERSVSLTTREQSLTVNKALKKGKKEKIEPKLLLNVLDFAGQKNYRPMHHCFIRRRSMYIVVFNLQDMRKYMEEAGSLSLSYNPLEEVRYWLHSIHSHIYPPEKDERKKDEFQRRVVLVGTHRNPPGKAEVTEDDCKKINELFEEEILKDDRCVDHIRNVSERCFVSVENSCSVPKESGAAVIRDTLQSIKGQLQFLDEVYPISWLRFESKIIELKKRPNQNMCVPVKEVQKISEGIADDALEFFHDIGEIILLRRVSKLFVSKEESEMISDLVVIDPKWLISVMQIIVELKSNCPLITGREQKNLKCGKATLDVLKRLWEDPEIGAHLRKSKAVDAEKVAIILQAYCLIHPYNPNTSDTRCFIIPSMLPSDPSEQEKRKLDSPEWIDFYFDFERFLPIEVFHRLVCMLLAEVKKSDSPKCILSQSVCSFPKVSQCSWKVELKSRDHKIKVSVKISGDKLKPSECIEKIHCNYLKRICEESSLQGLKYHGGPELPCHCLQQQSIFTFVKFDPDCDESDDANLPLECPECQVEWKPEDKRSASQKLDDIFAPQDSPHKYLSPELTVSNLYKELKTLTVPIPFGIRLNIPQERLEIIKRNDPQDVDDQKIALFEYISKNYKTHEPEITWKRIAEALQESDYGNLAADIRKKLP